MAESADQEEVTKPTPKEQFAKVQATGINAQCTFFLRTYVQEFGGRFEEVLQLAEDFKKYAPAGATDDVRELEEDKAHLFLEKRGETMTVKDLRDRLNEIDINKNHRISFIEYLLYKYAKTVDDLFAERDKPTSAALLQALEDAIAAFQQTLATREARDEQIRQLELIAETAQNVAEVKAGAKQRAAQKAVDKEDPFVTEQKRVAEEKKKAEAAEKLKREESRRRLKDKMAAMALS